MTTRKLLVFAIASLFSFHAFSQDNKSMRFGMYITPQLDWERSGNTKLYAHDGVNGKFGFGLSTEFKITDNVHFLTGIGGTFSGGGENYNVGGDTIGYVTDKNQNFIKVSDVNSAPGSTYLNSGNTYYRLIHRDYKTSYVTIPVQLKMMTKPIGPFRYFGEFGGNIEILTKAHANDQVEAFNKATGTFSENTVTLTDLNIYSDCIPFKASLNVGAGAEYTLSGSTAVVFSLNYLRSFISATSGTSEYLYNGVSNHSSFALNAMSGHSVYGDGVALTIGILF